MKQSVNKFLCLLLVTASFFSCTKHQDDIPNPGAAVVAGSWKISSFTETSENNTNDYSGYTFNFASDGKLTASNGAISTNGTWFTSNTRFNIDLGSKQTGGRLGKLTDDWLIVSKTDTKITLKDDNEAHNEVLIFSKN